MAAITDTGMTVKGAKTRIPCANSVLAPFPLDLTAQDIDLMAQHDQLDVLDLCGPPAPDQQLQ